MKHATKLLWAGLAFLLITVPAAMAQSAGGGAGAAPRAAGPAAGPKVADAKPGDIRVMVTGAIREPLNTVADQIPAAIGHPVVIEFGSARGFLLDEALAGQDFEIAILLPDVNEKLLAAGKVLPNTYNIALVPVAIGLRGDPSKPLDLATPAGIKDAMLNAQSIKYAPTGAALLTVKNLFAKLQLDGKVKDNSAARGEAPLAAGQYEINLYPLSEIIPNKKLKNMGPVIPALQVPSVIQIVVGKHANDMKATQALIKFLQGPAIDAGLKEDGMIKNVDDGTMK